MQMQNLIGNSKCWHPAHNASDLDEGMGGNQMSEIVRRQQAVNARAFAAETARGWSQFCNQDAGQSAAMLVVIQLKMTIDLRELGNNPGQRPPTSVSRDSIVMDMSARSLLHSISPDFSG